MKIEKKAKKMDYFELNLDILEDGVWYVIWDCTNFRVLLQYFLGASKI